MDEVLSVLQNMSGTYQLIARLLYSSGLRLNEALQLRVKDLDFTQQQIVVLNAKGMDSRITMLSPSVVVFNCGGRGDRSPLDR